MITDNELAALKYDSILKGINEKIKTNILEVRGRLDATYPSERNFESVMAGCINLLNDCVQLQQESFKIQKERNK